MLGSKRLGDICDLYDGPFGSYLLAEDYSDGGIPLLRMQNVTKEGMPNLSDVQTIPHQSASRLSKYYAYPNDLVVTKIGFLGYATVLPEDYPLYIFRRELTRCLPFNVESYLPAFLAAFFNGRFGRGQFYRYSSGTTRDRVLLTSQRRILVPLFSKKFQESIERCFVAAQKEQTRADAAYENAEQTLLRTLGLEDWQPPELLTYERKAREVFAAGRLDAEHYQEQYHTLAKKLLSYKNGCVTLGDICPNPVNGVEIREYEDEGVPYLRVGDLHNLTVNLDSVMRIAPMAAAQQISKVKLESGDVLISRSGSLAIAGVVEPEWAHSVISSHLIRIRLKQIFDPYYVALFLSSVPGRIQIEQQSNGGVQPEINHPSLKSILLPMLDIGFQNEIHLNIKEFHAARKQAISLLDQAKCAVEIAIEETEKAAMEFLKQSQRALS